MGISLRDQQTKLLADRANLRARLAARGKTIDDLTVNATKERSARMKLPENYKVNGYTVMQVKDGWEVGNSDRRLAGPFDREEDAVEAAKALPSKGEGRADTRSPALGRAIRRKIWGAQTLLLFQHQSMLPEVIGDRQVADFHTRHPGAFSLYKHVNVVCD